MRKLQFCLFSVCCKRYTLTYRSLAPGGSPQSRESTVALQTKAPASLVAKRLLLYYRLPWFATTSCVEVRRSGGVDSLSIKRGLPPANRGLSTLQSGLQSYHKGCGTVLCSTCGRLTQAAGPRNQLTQPFASTMVARSSPVSISCFNFPHL